ncbi:hydantoinase/oxoprolinase family protein [Limibacillus halophilus]|uniref:N-methylhydantoinase A n=1 Tax=Limibacillus halophilus TaxID=1579333 RepID=A0A839SUP1_9PROT|nr:hydantoinase/oxoprolinase family protein [Limibacillus halophilus]MBB3065400.1 N-methylhydantoinase A [Limibacillus halophilus]
MAQSNGSGARLAVDIGGTFTDVALEHGDQLTTTKTLTTPRAPEQGVLTGIAKVLADAKLSPADIAILIHGTTLATNALIERKGAKTALICTEGFRDSLEMAYENRFEQYDINVDRPKPLVPRHLRLPVTERISASGDVLIELAEDTVHALIPVLRKEKIESVAIGLIHGYANPVHELRIAEILRRELPGISLSLASEVCPEIREYERQSTTCANAYVQPLMARYLKELELALQQRGFSCPFFLITSGGGLTDLETARRLPIRLVESGPAGGAILASRVALELGLESVLSYDMGGTTAKVCLIDDGLPLKSRTFEVDRAYRFMKGSGLPVRIPVIEMVEIGAGGGSIAAIDSLGRIAVGPESAGSEPGPACYGLGGTEPTVTDADTVLGRIDPSVFSGGSVNLDPEKAAAAVAQAIGDKLNMDQDLAAFGIVEMVDENMANAARVHAIEWGKDVASRTMIAFGGAAPLHAARLGEKLEIDRIVIPTGAGVGSAIGFLKAPVAYEVVRSRYMRLSSFDAKVANAVMEEMRAEAQAILDQGAPGAALVETAEAFMRYHGQGHEISVAIPTGRLTEVHGRELRQAFTTAYEALYGRSIPGMDIEVLSWTLTLSTKPEPVTVIEPTETSSGSLLAKGTRSLFDPGLGKRVEAAVYWRDDLSPGHRIQGPAVVVEAQTTTVISAAFEAEVNARGYVILERRRNA